MPGQGTTTTRLAAVLGMALLHGAAVVAQQASSVEGTQAGMPHGEHEAHAAAASAGEEAHAFTLNVFISDEGIEPSTLFVPAGQRVQLVVRNLGATEHHYRVVGLVPRHVRWMADPALATSPLDDVAPLEAEGTADHSMHHPRAFVDWRAPAPSGITPTGDEVHAYVSAERNLDVLLFTPTNTGTFDVACDLHAHTIGRLTVFDDPSQPAAPVAAGGNLALTRALSRDLGAVDYAGVAGVRLEVTYAPEEYVARVLGPASLATLQPDRYVTMLLSETSHTATLPAALAAPELRVSGRVVPLVDRTVITDSVHHRSTALRFARDDAFGHGHQVMTMRLASGQEATWHLPLLLPDGDVSRAGPVGLGDQWALILAILGGMLAAMWPCLFQLTVYFIPALAGVAMQEGAEGSKASSNRLVLRAAFFFILGFTMVYTATGALIGYAAQHFGGTAEFEAWQRYFGIGAGIIVIGLALRVAAKVRAPLVCRMPVLSGMANASQKRGASAVEMMLAGLAFATGCMTCFGSALVLVMVVYIGLAQSAFYGALVLFLFSLGMGIPLVIAAMAMARTLPLLLKLERAVPWMGLVSALLMVSFGVLLISGNYMIVSEWTYRAVDGAAALPGVSSALILVSGLAVSLGLLAWLAWMAPHGKLRRAIGSWGGWMT
jgi:cytochrome c-type biogenesis protein